MDSNKISDMKCKGCDKQLTESELAVMTQYHFDRCVECRKKQQKYK